MGIYTKTIEQLEAVAAKWWPKALEEEVAGKSVIPLLLKSQEKFISLLKLAGEHPEQIFDVLKASKLPANLFLKHLCVLADYGGEPMQRLGKDFEEIFLKVKDNCVMDYYFDSKKHRYVFSCLPVKGLSNKKLDLDGANLVKQQALSPIYKDMIMIILHGSTSDSSHLAGLEKCNIGTLLGNDEEIEKYVREKYIHVSRITQGASANDLGQVAQSEVVSKLEAGLGNKYSITRNGKIKLTDYEKDGGMPFDLVVEKNGKKIGVEVSFQVTTNSTIERKAGQAADRQAMMHKDGFKIAYVLDGAGNFQRRSAISTLCKFSDCTVAYTDNELAVLVEYIKDNI